MSDPGYIDEFGFYAPLPLDRAARREPGADFPTGPEIGSALPAVCLPPVALGAPAAVLRVAPGVHLDERVDAAREAFKEIVADGYGAIVGTERMVRKRTESGQDGSSCEAYGDS